MNGIWSENCEINKYPSLEGHLETEVLIIGAGLSGILTGFLLQECGKQVTLIEADRISSGQSGRTTAKITAQHGLFYHALLQRFGLTRAKQYAAAQQSAIAAYQDLIQKYNIACDFRKQNAYLYCQDPVQLKAEHAALKALGLSAKLLTGQELPPLPFSCNAALCMENQAELNPLALLQSLSGQLTIYEHTPALSVQEHDVTTPAGSISAKQIIFACHYPFINFPGLFFARMYQSRSYVLALENADFPDGMWIGSLSKEAPSPQGKSREQYSFRHAGPYLLLGGEGHISGAVSATSRYDALRQKAREWFPHSHEAAHWSAQDCMSIDHVPYIGAFSAKHPYWYIATGFQKWGMTNAMAAALLLRDLLCHQESPFARVFDPRRFALRDLPSIAALGGKAAGSIAKRIFQMPSRDIDAIAPGHGAVVLVNGKKVGIYKDLQHEIFAVDIRCPHLGCQLAWNQDELSWDCPCHGSRYDYKGNLLDGPAQKSNIRLFE